MQTHRKSAAQTIEPHDFLLPDPALRRRTPAQGLRPVAIEDAVFEVVTSPAAGARPRHNDNPASPKSDAQSRWLPLTAHMAGKMLATAEKRLGGLSPQAFTTLISSLAVLVFWLCGGFSALTATMTPSNLAPYELVRPAIHAEDANGMKIALVTGAVRNVSGRIIDAPRFAVVSGGSREILGTIALSVERIGPGVTMPFSARFKLAGGKSEDLTIIPERP